jgi:hypothetical protein
MKLVKPEAVPKRSVLLYGPPKTGKTAGAATAPKPALLLNVDLPNASWFAHQREEGLYEIGYESFNDTLMVLGQHMKDGDLTFGGLLPEPAETFIIDPVGELYRRMMEDLSGRAVSPSLPTYQAVQVHLERFCRAFCESPLINFVMTAHENPVQDESSGNVEMLLWAGTKSNSLHMSQKLMGMVDVVGYTAVVEKEGGGFEYVAQLVNGKGRRGGDRFDSLLEQGQVARAVNLTEWFNAGAKPEKEKAA